MPAPQTVGRARPRELGAVWLLPLLLLFAAVTALIQPAAAPVGDEGPLLHYAERLLHGHYAEPATINPVAYLWHGPGLPLLLSPFVAAGVPVPAMRFLGALALFGAVLVFHRLLRTRVGPRAALAGAYALGLYVPFYQPLRSLHKEPLAVLLVGAAMLGTSRYLARGRWRHMALAGAALGALAMVRVEYGWVILAMLVGAAAWWLLRGRPVTARRTAAVFAVAFAACLPWLAYTHHLTGRVLYWGNSGGISLYWMSPTQGPGETGQWHAAHTVFRSPALASYRPYFARLRRLAPLERDLALQRTALANIRARPLLYVRNLAANVARLWFLAPVRPRPPTGPLVMYALFNGVLLLSVIWAARSLLRRRHALAPETLPFAALAGLGLAIHVLPSADPRMTLPMIPLLVWLVVYASSRRSRGAQAVEAPAGRTERLPARV